MRYWNNFSNDLSRMQFRMNQTLWESGIGRGGPGLKDALAAGKKKKKKRLKNGIPKGLETDAQQMTLDLSETEMQQENMEQQDIQETRKNLMEQQASAMKTGGLSQETDSDGWQMKDPAALQDAIVWAEILGEPVSIKRRKRRVNQYYGD